MYTRAKLTVAAEQIIRIDAAQLDKRLAIARRRDQHMWKLLDQPGLVTPRAPMLQTCDGAYGEAGTGSHGLFAEQANAINCVPDEWPEIGDRFHRSYAAQVFDMYYVERTPRDKRLHGPGKAR